MPTIARTNRAHLTHIVDIALDPDEQPPTIGDRKKGTADRRPARIIGYHLHYEWSDTYQRWSLVGSASNVYVRQQRGDQTWGDQQTRTLPHDDRPALEQQYLPDTTPVVTW